MGSVKTKICGITNESDARCCVEAGADYIGFIFYPPSKRYIEPEFAKRVADSVRGDVSLVGVFVDETPEAVRAIAKAVGLDRVQLHGDESLSDVEALSDYAPIKALSFTDANDVSAAAPFKGVTVLVDTPCADHGGSGELGDLASAAAVASTHECYLAGGLTPENVVECIELVRPFGVDVSTGVEHEKGIKDHDAVRLFLERARSVEF